MEQATELAALRITDGWLTTALSGGDKRVLEQTTLPEFLPRQRWFGAKDSVISGVELIPLGDLEPGTHALTVLDVVLAGETQRYFMPLSAAFGDEVTTKASPLTPVLARISTGEQAGVLIDSAQDRDLAGSLLQAMRQGTRLVTPAGEVVFEATAALAAAGAYGEPRALGAEQSNISIAFGSDAILKLYRRLRAGEQPDVEVARFLTEVGRFANTPPFLGEIRYRARGEEPTTLAAGFAFVANRGDAWTVVTDDLYQDLKRHGLLGSTGEVPAAAAEPEFSPSVLVGELLGRRTAELHKALAVETDDTAFTVEPLSAADVLLWTSEAVVEANNLLDRLEQGLSGLAVETRGLAREVLASRGVLIERIGAAAAMTPSGGRSRIHGDYHLGQVLVTDGDFMIIDFEGEPRRSLKERRAKSSPLRDVAGMLRSFHYAAQTALNRYRSVTGTGDVEGRVEAWRQRVSADFLDSYGRHIKGAASYPDDPGFAQALADLFVLQKAIYEIAYELANRPDWIAIPLSGVRDLLNRESDL